MLKRREVLVGTIATAATAAVPTPSEAGPLMGPMVGELMGDLLKLRGPYWRTLLELETDMHRLSKAYARIDDAGLYRDVDEIIHRYSPLLKPLHLQFFREYGSPKFVNSATTMSVWEMPVRSVNVWVYNIDVTDKAFKFVIYEKDVVSSTIEMMKGVFEHEFERRLSFKTETVYRDPSVSTA